MIDINAYLDYLDELGRDEQKLQALINEMYNRADGSGEAAEYNNAVVGMDVKDRIVKLALIIRGIMDKASGDITAISTDAAFLTALRNVLTLSSGDVKFSGDVFADGDKKLATKEQLSTVYGNPVATTWARGSIDVNTGEDTSVTTFIRSGFIAYNDRMAVLSVPGGVLMRNRIYFYGSSNNYLGMTAYANFQSAVIFARDYAPAGAAYIRVSSTRYDGAGIPTASVDEIAKNVIIVDTANSVARKLSTGIDNVDTEIYGSRYSEAKWKIGAIDPNDGSDISATSWICSDMIPYTRGMCIFSKFVSPRMRCRAYNYDENGDYLGFTSKYNPTTALINVADYAPDGTAFIRVSALKSSGGTIAQGDIYACASQIVIATSQLSLAGQTRAILSGSLGNDLMSQIRNNGEALSGCTLLTAGTYDFLLDNPCCKAGLLTMTVRTVGTCAVSVRVQNENKNNLYITASQQLDAEAVTTYEHRILGKRLSYDKLLIHVTVPVDGELYVYDAAIVDAPILDKGRTGLVFSSVHGETEVCNSDTMPAFVAAADLGYPYVIATPKRTSDGMWICYHDDKIDVDDTFIRDDDGNALAATYDNATFDTIPYANVIETWDFGVSRAEVYKGTRAVKVSDYLMFCAKRNLHPGLSMHPTSTTSIANLTEIKAITDKYNMTNVLTLKYPDGTTSLGNALSVFGNSVERYVVNINLGETNLANRIDAILAQANAANVSHDKIVIEVFAVDATAANADIIRGKGLIASVAQISHSHAGGSASAFMYTSEIKAWMELGYTEFTLNRSPFYGINF